MFIVHVDLIAAIDVYNTLKAAKIESPQDEHNDCRTCVGNCHPDNGFKAQGWGKINTGMIKN